MSWFVGLAGIILNGVGHTLVAIATFVTAIKANQSEDPTEKGALRAAAGFLGISILLGFISVILGIVLAGTKGCSKKNKIAFIIFFVLFAISYIIALVIIAIYRNKRTAAGDTAGARDLNAAFYLPLVAIPLYLIGFVCLYVFIGRRLRAASRACQNAKNQGARF